MRFFVDENNLNAVVQWYATYPHTHAKEIDIRAKILSRLKDLYLPRLADFNADPTATARAAAFECVYGPIFAYPDFDQRVNSEVTDFININLYVRPRLDEPDALLEVSVR